jgi:hypothetical protein
MAEIDEKSPILDAITGGLRTVVSVAATTAITALLLVTLEGHRVDVPAWVAVLIGLTVVALFAGLEWVRVRQINARNRRIARLEGALDEAQRARAEAEAKAAEATAAPEEPALSLRARQLLESMRSIRAALERRGSTFEGSYLQYEVKPDERERFVRLVGRAYTMFGGVPKSLVAVVRSAREEKTFSAYFNALDELEQELITFGQADDYDGPAPADTGTYAVLE